MLHIVHISVIIIKFIFKNISAKRNSFKNTYPRLPIGIH